MFSEELRILDRNTVHLMIDELQMEVDDLHETINEKDKTIAEQTKELSERNKIIYEQNDIIKKSIALFITKAIQSGDTRQSISEQLCEVYGITKEQAEEYIN